MPFSLQRYSTLGPPYFCRSLITSPVWTIVWPWLSEQLHHHRHTKSPFGNFQRFSLLRHQTRRMLLLDKSISFQQTADCAVLACCILLISYTKTSHTVSCTPVLRFPPPLNRQAESEPSPTTALWHPTGQQPTSSISDWLLSCSHTYLWLAVEHVLLWVTPDASSSCCQLPCRGGGRVESRYLARLLAVNALTEDLEAGRERRVASCSLDLFLVSDYWMCQVLDRSRPQCGGGELWRLLKLITPFSAFEDF